MARRQAKVGSLRKVASEFGVSKSTVHRAASVKLDRKSDGIAPKKFKLDLKKGFTPGGSAK